MGEIISLRLVASVLKERWQNVGKRRHDTPLDYGFAPLASADGRGGTSGLSERDVMNVPRLTLEACNLDRDRVDLAGHSMGGSGTLRLAIKYPDIWAALGGVAPAGRVRGFLR